MIVHSNWSVCKKFKYLQDVCTFAEHQGGIVTHSSMSIPILVWSKRCLWAGEDQTRTHLTHGGYYTGWQPWKLSFANQWCKCTSNLSSSNESYIFVLYWCLYGCLFGWYYCILKKPTAAYWALYAHIWHTEERDPLSIWEENADLTKRTENPWTSDDNGIWMDLAKVNSVLKWKTPTTKGAVLSFLGSISYLADDISGVQILMSILHRITGATSLFRWDATHQCAFDEIKDYVQHFLEHRRKPLDYSPMHHWLIWLQMYWTLVLLG
jgi:hypothetical protein